jgi:SAM-dependent methyltransferase
VIHDAASRGFSRDALAYERGRPGYPEEALAWLIGVLEAGPGRVVVDVGAGTGKLTRQLAASGAEIVAVEPVAAMRELLETGLPGVRTLAASAEALPLDDGSADAVVSGQAFHWFDGPRALVEFHRVLRPGGRLGLIWNTRREEQPLQRGIEEIIAPYRGDTPSHKSGAWRDAFEEVPLFELVDELSVAHEQEIDRDLLIDRVASTSFIAALPAEERTRVVARVASLAEREPPRLAYLAEVFVFSRSA